MSDWSFGIEDSWVSGFSQVAGPVTATINNWVNPYVNSWNQVDVNITRNFVMDGADLAAYFVVQNLLNAQPAYVPNGTIGQWYPVYTSATASRAPWAAPSPSGCGPICSPRLVRPIGNTPRRYLKPIPKTHRPVWRICDPDPV